MAVNVKFWRNVLIAGFAFVAIFSFNHLFVQFVTDILAYFEIQSNYAQQLASLAIAVFVLILLGVNRKKLLNIFR